MKLKNKKIVVFGGTSGIGLETIKLLLQNGVSKVYAISRNPKKVKIRKKQLILEKADVLDEASLKALFKRIGKYDVLVSTATGGERAIGPFLSMNIVIATGNKGKFSEIIGFFSDLNCNFVSLNQFDIKEPEETGLTFEENAILKSEYYSLSHSIFFEHNLYPHQDKKIRHV